MAAVAYIRVSTERQVEEGHGLDVQLAQVTEWCTRNDVALVEVFRDEGLSGSKGAGERPGLARALAALEDGADLLIIPKLDRLARALTVQEAVLAQAWRAGARVVATDVGEILRDDPDDPMRTAMRQMAGVFAQLERSMIAARMRAGRRQKALSGGYAGFGSPRFGSQAVDRELTPDPAEQETIARIVALRDAGGSLRTIVGQLTAEGRRPKRGERWHVETVRRVLARVPDPERAEAA